MFGLHSASHGGRFAVLFDIGSASIGVSILDFQGKPSKLVWSKRFEYGYLSGDDYDRYSKTMYATLLEAGMKASTEGFQTLKSAHPSFSSRDVGVYCILSPPWFYGTLHTEIVSKEKPFQVTNSILDTITKDSVSHALQTPESLLWQEVMGKPQVLESYNDRVFLDGYSVDQYEKRSTKELRITSYIAIVAKNVQKHIDEVIEKVFPNFEYTFTTSVRVLSGLKKHLYVSSTAHRTMLIEVEEEITGIALLENDSLKSVASIPFGTNHILRAISPNAQTAAEAKTAIEVLLKKNTEIDTEGFPEALETTLTAWHEELVEKIRTLSGGVTPPTEVFLVTGNMWSALFKHTLKASWEMPGIRKNVELAVYPVTVPHKKKDSKETTQLEDNRLSIFAHILSRYMS